MILKVTFEMNITEWSLQNTLEKINRVNLIDQQF